MVVCYLLFSYVSMSHIPVSAVIICDGVVIGACNMRLIGLYRILCTKVGPVKLWGGGGGARGAYVAQGLIHKAV